MSGTFRVVESEIPGAHMIRTCEIWIVRWDFIVSKFLAHICERWYSSFKVWRSVGTDAEGCENSIDPCNNSHQVRI